MRCALARRASRRAGVTVAWRAACAQTVPSTNRLIGLARNRWPRLVAVLIESVSSRPVRIRIGSRPRPGPGASGARLEAVHLRHPHVHDGELGLVPGERLDPSAPLRASTTATGRARALLHQLADRRVVVDHEDQRLRLGLRSGAHDPPPAPSFLRASTTTRVLRSNLLKTSGATPPLVSRALASSVLQQVRQPEGGRPWRCST